MLKNSAIPWTQAQIKCRCRAEVGPRRSQESEFDSEVANRILRAERHEREVPGVALPIASFAVVASRV